VKSGFIFDLTKRASNPLDCCLFVCFFVCFPSSMKRKPMENNALRENGRFSLKLFKQLFCLFSFLFFLASQFALCAV
jgi:hypothetical protein